MLNQNINPDTRDYSFNQIEEDPRIKRTTKEFFITFGTYVLYAILMILNLFTLGLHSSDYPKPCGIPLWIFVLICLLIAMVVTVEVICTFVYKDMDLSPSIKSEDRGE